jgi:hypothetical protein
MLGIWQRDVDRVDALLLHGLLEVVVVERGHPVLSGKFLLLCSITGDQGSELRVLRVRECGKHRGLRDVPEPNDSVADAFCGSFHFLISRPAAEPSVSLFIGMFQRRSGLIELSPARQRARQRTTLITPEA